MEDINVIKAAQLAQIFESAKAMPRDRNAPPMPGLYDPREIKEPGNKPLPDLFSREIKPVDNPREIRSVETENLLSSIMASDVNNDGSVSKDEISSKINEIKSKIIHLISMRTTDPNWLEKLSEIRNQYQTQIQSLNMIKNNFDAFSKGGNKNVIDGQDIMNVVNAAKADKNSHNFSQKDLNKLKGLSNPIETIELVDFQALLSADLNNDGGTSKTEVSTQIKILESQIAKLKLQDDANGIAKLQTQINTLTIIKDNFEAFSKGGKDPEKIEQEDIARVLEAAKADGRDGTFSQKDLDALKKL